jgi:hypothetical protein
MPASCLGHLATKVKADFHLEKQYSGVLKPLRGSFLFIDIFVYLQYGYTEIKG